MNRFGQFKAFVWMRMCETRRTFMPGRGRSKGKVVAAWLGLGASLVFGAFLTVVAIALSFGAWMAAQGLLGDAESRSGSQIAIRIALAVGLALTLVFPVARAVRRSVQERTRVLLLPISLRDLFAIDLLAGLGDPWLLVFIPALVVVAITLVQASVSASLIVLVVAGLYLLALAAIGAVVTIAAELIFRDRRRSESIAIATVLLWVGITMGLTLLDDQSDAVESAPAEKAITVVRLSLGEVYLWWGQLLPSESAAQTIAHASAGRLGAAAAPLITLAIQVCLLLLLAWKLWQKRLASPETISPRRSTAAKRPSLLKIPGLSEEISAVAWMQIRTALRTVQGKLGLVAPAFFMFLIGAQLSWMKSGENPFFAMFDPGPQLAFGGVAFALLTLHPIVLNQFSIDGTGLTRLFLVPLHELDIVFGKAAAIAILATISSSLCVLASATFHPGSSLLAWPAVVAGSLAAVTLLLPPFLWLSLIFPKPVDLSRLGKASQPHMAAMLIGAIVTVIALLPSMAIGGLGLMFFGPFVAFLLELLWLAATVLIALPLLRLSAPFVVKRREATLLALRDGS